MSSEPELKTQIYIKAGAAVGPHGDIDPGQRRRLEHDAEQPSLEALRKTLCQQSLRQASRLVEMGVVGAALLRRNLPEFDRTGIVLYVATGLGDLAKNNAIFSQVLPPANGLASPFDFINSSANTTAFYVAREWGFDGRNLTLSSGEFSFETALQRGLSDLKADTCSGAMIGGLDEYLAPRDLHLDRLGLPDTDESILGEGCGWLFLDRNADNAIGRVVAVFDLVVDAAITDQCWARQVYQVVAEYIDDPRLCVLLPGFRVGAAPLKALLEQAPQWRVWDYLQLCGHFPTAAAFGIAASLESEQHVGKTLVHINRDAFGKTVGVIYQRFN